MADKVNKAKAEPYNGGLSLQSAMPAVDCVINPYRVADIASPVAGIIEKLYVERSQEVSAGQVVAQLDAKVERANVNLARSRASVESEIGVGEVNVQFDSKRKVRVDSLRQQQNISEENADQVEREARLSKWKLKQAKELAGFRELELKRAIEQLNQKSIKAPFSGFILDTYKENGEHVEDQAIMRLAQLDPLVVEAIVPMENFGLIKAGMLAEIRPDVLVDKNLTGKVTIVDRMGDTASNTFGVKLELANPDNLIPAGLKCVVKFLEPTDEEFEQPGTKVIEDAEVEKELTAEPEVVAALSEESAVAEVKPVAEITPPIEALEQTRSVSGYVVLAEQGETRKDTNSIIESLFNSGVTDLQEVGHGPFRDMIMLGLYNNHHVAVRRQKALEKLGFKTYIGDRNNGVVEEYATASPSSENSQVTDTVVAKMTHSELTAQEMNATPLTLAEEKRKQPSGFVVLANQGVNQQETREIIKYLRVAGVDDLMEVDHGPFKGKIMLGLYNRRYFAEKRKNELEQLGFTTYIDGRY